MKVTDYPKNYKSPRNGITFEIMHGIETWHEEFYFRDNIASKL
jgi:hypothetical protein